MKCPIVMFLFLLTLPSTYGREPAILTSLRGDEALLVLRGVRGGPSGPQGVYALDSDGNVKLVVPSGRDVRWSRDHKSVVFLADESFPPVLYRIDVSTNSCHRIGDSGDCWRDVLFLPGQSTLRSHSLAWTPSGESVVAWGVYMAGKRRPFQGPFAVSILAKQSGLLIDLPMNRALIAPEAVKGDDGFIGAVSFGPADSIAYEWHSRQLWCGSQESEVWSYDRARKDAVRVHVPLSGCVGAMNPLWSPEGKWLAVDAILDSGRDRRCVILSADFKTVRDLPRPTIGKGDPPDTGYQSGWSGIAWSPDGTRILLAKLSADDGLLEGGGLAVADVAEGGTALELSRQPIVQACWSPEGSRIACLGIVSPAVALGPARSRWVVLDILTVDGHEVHSRPVSLPKDMVPVSIDW